MRLKVGPIFGVALGAVLGTGYVLYRQAMAALRKDAFIVALLFANLLILRAVNLRRRQTLRTLP